MSHPAEIINHPVALGFVIDGNNSEVVKALPEHGIDRTDYIRNRQLVKQIFPRMAGSSEKYDSFQPLLLFKADCNLDFILFLIHLLKNKQVLLSQDITFQHLNHRAEKRIADPLCQDCNCVTFRPLQVPGTVVWNILVFRNGVKDLFLRLRIDIRVVVNRTGDRADTDSADLCYFLNCDLFHVVSFLPSQPQRPQTQAL